MKLKTLIDFTPIMAYASIPTNPDLEIEISSITEAENCGYVAGEDFNRLSISIQPSNNYIDFTIYNDNITVDYVFGNPTDFYDNLRRILEDEDKPLIITGDVNEGDKADFVTMLALKMVNIDIDGYTGIILYRQNSANNVVNKTLNLITILQGRFNIPIGLKSFYLDIEGTTVDFSAFNYIHIPKFERYYYVSSVQLVTNKIVRFNFSEDVLMTWQALIRNQNAFVTRQENTNNKDVLIDNRLPIRDDIVYDYFNPINLSVKNVTFNFKQAEGGGSTGYDESNYNILVSTYTKDQYTNSSPYPIEAPSGSDLPDISPLRTSSTMRSFLDISGFGGLVNACVKDDTTASFVQTALWLPFNPINTDIFPHLQPATNGLHANGKVLDGTNGGEWVNYGSETNPVHGVWLHDGACPYLIVSAFKFDNTGGIYDIDGHEGIEIYPPLSKWEIFIPFVGWVEIDINAVKGKTIYVYYTMDLDTGLSTAYIYNRTDKVILWSQSCQIGIRLNITTTNELENTKQKQANDLNMILGTMSSVLSIGVGVATENPVAVVGGVLSASKTIASNVQSNSMLFDRASMSFGTSNTALYSKTEVQVRRSYHYLLPKDDDIYAKLQGYPANNYTSLSALTGYTEIGDIQFNPSNYAISQDEINEIVTLLRNGVIL